MKKLFFTLIVTVITSSLSVNAQSTDAWRGSVEVNPIFSTVEGVDPSFNVNFAFTRKVSDYFSIGAGLGVNESFDFSTSPTIPVFARFNAESFSRKLSPFVTLDVGYGMNTDNFDYSGLIINPTVGVRFGAFSLGVGYYGFKSFKEGVKMSSSINVRLGYTFGFHRSNSAFARAMRKLEFTIDLGARFPLGGGVDFHKVDEDRLTTSGGEEWVDKRKIYDINARYNVSPDITLSLLYPATDNFYVGLMAGVNILFSSENSSWVSTYFDSPYDDEGKTYEHDFVNSNVESDTKSSAQFGARMKYKFKELTFGKRFYPYAQLDLGYNIDWDLEDSSSFYYSPTVGISMDVAGGKHSLNLGVSYVPQKLWSSGDSSQVTIDHNDNVIFEEGGYKNKASLKVSIGYSF